ncbi:hypothetical protein BGZ92_002626, partial [Podila epicladia]
MAEHTAPVVLMNDKEQQWLDGAIHGNLLRLIDFDDIKQLRMGVASGGFGIIHSGHWRGMRVAVKVLYNPADFIQEVSIHKMVQDSENIVKFYGITRMKNSGDYGMVLQFAGRGSLRDYLSQHFHRLDWGQKMRLAHDVAAGVSFIHEDNICHHDLHSRNVLIDQTGRALITDFGLSRYVNNANSNNGVRGVVPYISPERLKNSPFDHSSDVYSLGVIMWELTSGHPPFSRDGDNFLLPFEIMRGRREEIVPGTPIEYSDLYQRCWDGEPQHRPALSVVLNSLDAMLVGYNGDLAAENGDILPLSPSKLQEGPKSMPTETTTVAVPPLAFVRNSEPITSSVPSLRVLDYTPDTPAPVKVNRGSPTQAAPTASVKPLNPRHAISRNVTPIVTHFNDDRTTELADRFSTCNLIEDGNDKAGHVHLPVTPTKPAWIQADPAHLHARITSPARPNSPLPQHHPVHVRPNYNSVSREHSGPWNNVNNNTPSPKNANDSPRTLSEMSAAEDNLPEIGQGTPVQPFYQHNHQQHYQQQYHYQQQQHQLPHQGYPPQPEHVIPPGPPSNNHYRENSANSAKSGNAYGNGSSPTVSRNNSNGKGNWMPKNGLTNIKDFFTACRSGNLEAVQWHLAHGADVMAPYETMSSRTPIHAAAMSDSYEVMRILCEAAGSKLNMNELDDSSQTPLHLLTHYGRNSHELLVYMLNKGANPNAQDSERRTPLMTSFILNDNPQLVETLLDFGADPNLRCQENNALAEASI